MRKGEVGHIGNKFAVGNSGGKTVNDRKLAAKVRSMTLREIVKVYKNPDNDRELWKQVFLKLVSGVLPRINEISAPDGGSLNIGVVVLPTKHITETNENILEANTKTDTSIVKK